MKKVLVWLMVLSGSTLTAHAQTALDEYIAKPDPSYSWEKYADDKSVLATTYFLRLVSQQWRTVNDVDRPIWEHELKIIVPSLDLCKVVDKSRDTVILLINGGDNEDAPGTEVNQQVELFATSLCIVTAELKQVPNQPLRFADEFGRERNEDEILAYSMSKYLETGDSEWPVQLAMTKAAVRAMDAIQEFLEDEEGKDIDHFVVVGGSKRGWTTWLAAAVDPRITAIVPISIDLLNLGKQFVHHWETYGFYAPAVNQYVEYDLGCRILTPEGQDLLNIIDPYAYRDRYAGLPKLIINSAGDEFFVSDSSRFYYQNLPGPKYLRYTVNTSHSQGDTEDIIKLILAARSWIDDIDKDKEPPRFTWTFRPDGSIRVQTIDKPKKVKLWQAHNPNARDFRLEKIGKAWSATNLQDSGGGVYVGFVPPPAQGFTAFLVELEFEESALFESNQIFTTGVRVTPDTLPFKGTACQEKPNLTNLWWNPLRPQLVQVLEENGRMGGIWSLYDDKSKPLWTLFADSFQGTSLSTNLLSFKGPKLGAPWDNGLVSSIKAGTAALKFHSSSYATMDYTLNGVPGLLNLVPFDRLASGVYTGVWFDRSKIGQGVQILHRGNGVAGVWAVYDETGNSMWVAFSGQLAGGTLNAGLFRFNGPPPNIPAWDPDDLTATPVGSVSINFTSPTSATLSYVLKGFSGTLKLVPLHL